VPERPAEHFDVIVIGGGAVGLAAAWHAARRGRTVLVLEQSELPGDRGSSSGAERQWRYQYAQEDLARLVQQARPLWRELEETGGRRLIHQTGSLWFGDPAESTNEGQISAAIEILDRIGVRYERVSAQQIEERFHFARLPGHYEGFYQPDGGSVDVQGTLWVLYTQARSLGARLRPGERVLEINPDGEGVFVRTAVGRYRAEHVILAAGAFTNELLEPLGVKLDVRLFEMTSAYFRLRDPAIDYPTWFAFQPPTEEDTNLFYGFGRNPWAADDLVRVAPDFETDPLDELSQVRGTPDPRQLARVTDWVREHIPDLLPEPIQPSSCLIALPAAEERQFFLGRVPSRVPHGERLVVYSAGWGFKFVPLLGRACVDLAFEEHSDYELSRFAFG
jgi:sarcosine oxidase